jgi:hypothetical protein
VMMVLTYQHTGFPLDFFPVLFAVPRVVGWLAHWRQVRLLARQGGGCVLSRIVDDDSGRWREDLEAKTGGFPWVGGQAQAKLMHFPTLPRSTSVPRNGTTCRLTAENRRSRQEPYQPLSNIPGECLMSVDFSLSPLAPLTDVGL